MSARVAVLMGGSSRERDVSLQTGEAVAASLRRLGHEVLEIDVDRDLALRLRETGADAAFLALHGRGGEDGCVQGLLEVMRIPYTGCGVLASAVAMDKVVAKRLLAYSGIPVARDVVVERGEAAEAVAMVEESLGYPVMVKPASEGSSIAVEEVKEPSRLEAALGAVFTLDSKALVEEFIHGRLLTVGLVGKEPLVLPVLEIKPKKGFYDYRAKYEPGLTAYEVPAKIPPGMAEEANRLSLSSFRVLGCEDIARVDLMMEDGTGRMLLLEVNTIPGMTATSLVPKAAASAGVRFDEVVSRVLEGARLKVELFAGESDEKA